jgi:uncharacterized protein with PIN domain
MPHAHFRFYADLNDFLPREKQGVPFLFPFKGRPAVKDTLEALGVPHPEVDLILANAAVVTFAYHLMHGDEISVYPMFRQIDLSPLSRLRSGPPPQRFVLDTHLGRLAAYLRMCGFDTRYRNDFDDRTLADISSREGRVLLTRDRGLLKRRVVVFGYCLRSTNPRMQLIEVLRRYRLFTALIPFRRCMRCNGLLTAATPAQVAARVPPRTRAHFTRFRLCDSCGQVYWRGAHYDRMQRFLTAIVGYQ